VPSLKGRFSRSVTRPSGWIDKRSHAGSRLTATAFADELALHVKLAFSLIRHGLEELASLEGTLRGSLVIGTLPYSRTLLTPRTIHRVLEAHPALRISTREGPYQMLETALRNGEVDLIVGATRELDACGGLVTEPLFQDELAVIAGARHPLVRAPHLILEDLLAYGWVLPVRGTPARALFDACLAQHGCPLPEQVVESSSMALIRGLLLESDRVALLSRHQVHHDEKAGLLAALPVQLEGTWRPIGITRRAHTTPSPAATVFMAELRRMAKALALPGVRS
jgi:LysR family transcriptional regulator of gallate degradation